MLKLIIKSIFLFIWIFFFYEIIFDLNLRENLLYFCNQNPILAPLILLVCQILFACLLLPCSPLTLMAGLLWGFKIGILYSTLSVLFASIVTFYLSRIFFTSFFKRKIKYRFIKQISFLINKLQWKAAVLIYMNPVIPGSSLGYIFGLSKIKFKQFIIGSMIGTIPLQILIVGFGSSLEIFLSSNMKNITGIFSIFTVLILYKIFVSVKIKNS